MSGHDVFLAALEVRRQRRATLTLDVVHEAFRAAFPSNQLHHDAREELRSLLHDLAASGVIVLPKTKASWDRVREPPLPKWIRWPAAGNGRNAKEEARELPWAPQLEFVHQLTRVTTEELRFLKSVQAFLAEGAATGAILTVRERSLLLNGDDKRLERWMQGRLFGPGRLSAEILRCREVFPPLFAVDIGVGEDALIVENNDSFHSACEAARTLSGPVRWVIYGAGNAVLMAIPGVAQWRELPRRWWYFGDVDRRGLGIAVELSGRLAAIVPGAELRAAGPLYRQLLQRGENLGIRLNDEARGGPHPDKLVAWLPDGFRKAALEVLAARRRMPQELVDAQAMATGMRTLGELD